MATRGAREPGGDSVAAAPVTPAPAVNKAAPAKAKPAKPAKAAHKAPVHKAAAPQPKPEAAAPKRTSAERTAVKVTRALGRGDAVVFFFTRAGAADDTGTRQAVQAAQGHPHVMVVRAGLEDLIAFRPVLSGAGVSQVPAVVVAHAGKPARLLEGYVDSGTLRQTIADALR
jgi:hypothetical protein